MSISINDGLALANNAARGNLKDLRKLFVEIVNMLFGLTAGTVVASQAVVVDASKNIGTFLTVTATNFAGFWKVPRATVAAAGSTNADAAALTLGLTTVTAGDGTKGVILPVPAAGSIAIVKNNAASILKVYPGTGAAINALTATTGGISMAANTIAVFYGDSATQWWTHPLLPS